MYKATSRTKAGGKNDAENFELRLAIKPLVNYLKGKISRILGAFVVKERDKAHKELVKTLENTANTTSKNQAITERVIDRQGKLTSSV